MLVSGSYQSTVDQVEGGVYRDRQVWQITLGFPNHQLFGISSATFGERL
jgi:hypothetical protein